MDTIRQILSEYSVVITAIALAAISSMIVMFCNRSKKLKRFITLKKESINLWVYKSEREFSYDELLQQLYDGNLRLETENKLLKQEASDAGFRRKLILAVILIAMAFRKSRKDTKTSENQDLILDYDAEPIDINDNNTDDTTEIV